MRLRSCRNLKRYHKHPPPGNAGKKEHFKEEKKMKNKIVYLALTAVIGMAAFFTGKISSEPEPWEVIYPEKVIDWNTDGEELSISTSDGQEYYCYKTDNIYDSDYFDMSTVVDFVATEDGLQLYTADGCGYYWEREESHEYD